METLKAITQLLLTVLAILGTIGAIPGWYHLFMTSQDKRWRLTIEAASHGMPLRRPLSPPSQMRAAGLTLVATVGLGVVFYLLIFILVP